MRTTRCAPPGPRLEVRDALSVLAGRLTAERGLALDFRIGISTGEVITAVDARPLRRTTGEPLRGSSHLSREAGPGEILIDESARRLLRDAVVAEGGKGAWRLLQVADTAPGL